MRKFYFIGLIVFTGLLIVTMVIVGCFYCFFDIGSLLLVLLCTIFLLLANFSFSDIGRYFSIGFSKNKAEASEIRKGIVFFKAMQKYLLLSGGIGAMMGLIAMLAMLNNPEKIGRGLSLALITVLYGLFFTTAVAIPFRTGLEKKLEIMKIGDN